VSRSIVGCSEPNSRAAQSADVRIDLVAMGKTVAEAARLLEVELLDTRRWKTRGEKANGPLKDAVSLIAL
jgi:hypothetical protein